MTTTHLLGRLRVEIGGDDAILPSVLQELAPLSARSNESPHLRIRFTEDFPVLVRPVQVDGISVDASAYEAVTNRVRFQVRREDDLWWLFVSSELDSWKHKVAPDWLVRLRDRSYATPSENAAKDFLYNVFDQVTQVVGLDVGQSYLHASALDLAGLGVAFAAWGGVGKTSTVLELLGRFDGKLLSDDLAVIDESGMLHRSPKYMQVYAYNVPDGSSFRYSLLAGRSPADRLAFKLRARLLGTAQARRRVSPEQLLGTGRTAKSARLSYIALLRRADVPDISFAPISHDVLASHCSVTLLRELRPFTDVSTAIYSSTHTSAIPSPHALLERTASIVRSGLDAGVTEVVTIPLDAEPRRLGQAFAVRLAELDA